MVITTVDRGAAIGTSAPMATHISSAIAVERRRMQGALNVENLLVAQVTSY